MAKLKLTIGWIRLNVRDCNDSFCLRAPILGQAHSRHWFSDYFLNTSPVPSGIPFNPHGKQTRWWWGLIKTLRVSHLEADGAKIKTGSRKIQPQTGPACLSAGETWASWWSVLGAVACRRGTVASCPCPLPHPQTHPCGFLSLFTSRWPLR